MHTFFSRCTKSTAVLIAVGMVVFGFTTSAYAEEDSSDATATAEANAERSSAESFGPFGGNTWDVAVDPTSEYIYTVAKETPNGFYRSSDQGSTWAGISSDYDLGGSVAIEINPENGDVYVAFAGGLYKSADHGVTFTKINDEGSETLLYAQDQLMIATNSTPGALLISTDDGASFTTVMVNEGAYVWSLASSPTSGEFYAVTYENFTSPRLFRSENFGVEWSEVVIPEITDSTGSVRVAVNPTDPNNLSLTAGFTTSAYYSLDQGASWNATEGVISVTTVFDSLGRLYVGSYYSDDKGVNWTSMNDTNPGMTLPGHGLTIDPTNPNVMYGDGMPGFVRTLDRGVTWENSNQGINGITIVDISQATDKNIVWAAAYNGFAKTENFTDPAGPTWEFPVLADPGSSVWVNPENPSIVLAGELGAIKRTEDGGSTWTTVTPSVQAQQYKANQFVQDVNDPNIIYAAIGLNEPGFSKTGFVVKSEDLGLTWTDMELLDGASAQALAQSRAGDLYVGAGADGGITYKKGIYKFSEGVWTHLEGSPDEEVVEIVIDPNDDHTLFALANIKYGDNNAETFGVYKSTDDGLTWTKKTDGLEDVRTFTTLTVQPSTSPSTLYLGGSNQFLGQGVVYKSSDAGETWHLFYTGLKEQTFATMIFDGVEAGSSNGLIDLKSRATVTLTNPQVNRLRVVLKDAVTNKKIKYRKVTFYRMVDGEQKKIGTDKTNSHGVAVLKRKIKKTGKFKAVWIPSPSQSDEYIRSASTKIKVTVE